MKKFYHPMITALLFSGSFIAAKYTILDLEPLTTTFLRYFVALMFLSVLIFRYKLSALKVKKEHLFQIILLGLFGVIGYHFFFFSSLEHTSVTNTGIINAFIPVVTGLMAAVFIRERLSKKNYLGIFLAFSGVLVLITKGKLQTITQLDFNLGDLLMLLAVLSWAIYSLIVKHLSKQYSSFTLTFYATLSGVVMLFFLAIFEGGIDQVRTISLRSIYSVLYMGIFASGLGYLFYNYGIRNLGPTRTSSLVYSFVPLFVAILALIFFQEAFTLSAIVSVALIVFGFNLVLSKKEDKTSE